MFRWVRWANFCQIWCGTYEMFWNLFVKSKKGDSLWKVGEHPFLPYFWKISFHWNLSNCLSFFLWFYILYLIYIWRPLVVVHWSPSPTLCTLDNRSSSGNLFLVSLYIEAKEIGRFFKIDVLLISILAATVRDIAIVRGGFWFKHWTFELQR